MPQLSKFQFLTLIIVLMLATTACLKQDVDPVPAPGAESPELPLELRAKILMAEDQGELDEPLRSACSSADMQVREEAARALGRIGGVEAIRLAGALLDDPSHGVRAEAVLALGLSRDGGVLDRMLKLAGDESPRVRANLALALSLVPGDRRRPVLLALIGDPDPQVAEQACLSAATLQPSEEVVQRLAGMLENESRPVRRAAAYALARIGRKSVDSPANALARRKIQDQAQAQDPAIRLEVARGLRLPRNGSEEGVLKRLITDVERLVRIEALMSIAYPGGPPIQLLDGAADKDFHVVQAALEGMALNGDPSVIKALTEISINEGPVPIRIAAIHSLRRAGPALAAQMLPIQLWRSTDPRLREEAARTAGIYPLAVNDPFIDGLLKDNIPSVRGAAIQAAGHRQGDLSAVLGDSLSENHPDIRFALAQAAGERVKSRRSGLRRNPRQTAEAFALLDDLWDRGQEDTQAFPRLAVLDAVGEAEPDPSGRAILVKAAGHDDYRFRARAIRILAELYGASPDREPGPAATRPLQDYVRMLRWAEKNWDAVVTVKRAGFAPGSFTIRLDTDRALRTSWNFAQLAENGFYDGLTFHRLAPNFIIQGGDPWHDGLGDPGYTLLPEISNGPFHAGAVGMKQGVETGAGSQFFITLAPQRRLDARNVRFGTITENLLGVAMLLIPEDRILSIDIREAEQ
ncbi:MAG: HEAT repeat domain-containing protein [Acidobacteria bacterium]|uniref:HEAT repeat domain-containing protein n=1 Tax=Candidatus Polarisedimenticola svalbardensis TaxID=2886004 RepID=A0A8J6Y082_9BACT|nr:HEAT repeat domain-containing protein [Candidatus Polarisedimenticola svalbardensis]